MIADGKSGKIIEVDSSGKTVWEYQNADIGNMRMRSVRPTAQDTFLIAIEAVGKIIEVNRSGQIIWSYEVEGGNTRFPYQAHRLENGNTLISLAEPGGIVEVDSAGKTVRTIAGNKMDLRFGWVTGTQPLARRGSHCRGLHWQAPGGTGFVWAGLSTNYVIRFGTLPAYLWSHKFPGAESRLDSCSFPLPSPRHAQDRIFLRSISRLRTRLISF